MEGIALWAMAVGLAFFCVAITLFLQAWVLKQPEKKQDIAKAAMLWSALFGAAGLLVLLWGVWFWISQQ